MTGSVLSPRDTNELLRSLTLQRVSLHNRVDPTQKERRGKHHRTRTLENSTGLIRGPGSNSDHICVVSTSELLTVLHIFQHRANAQDKLK